ncbi:MAG: hypothetical protein LBI05_08780 [Planctomycetaceae bacterium]|jgi:hypothetical protein|nr:hypothetical protein [Planctomycetaceae bacterium]
MQKTILACCVISIFYVAAGFADTPVWDVQSDTWTFTDDLGRTLPDSAEAGKPKPDKFIGMFYFLWTGRHGDQGPFDISKILAADSDAIQKPDSPLWGPVSVFHHWGEPLFDYYVGEDEFVLRKHAQMLGDAGVDVIIFDVTNQLTYPESYLPLCKVFSESKRLGNKVPQIAFLTPFGQPEKVVRELWNNLYSKGEYADLWFRWKGKPLILADPALSVHVQNRYQLPTQIPAEATAQQSVGQTFTTTKEIIRMEIPIPTWNTKDAVATLTLYEKKPGGKKLFSKRFENISDNQWYGFDTEPPLPAGTYYLELTHNSGKLGWWSTPKNEKFPELQGFRAGQPVDEIRSMHLFDKTEFEETRTILDFFTFRKPQPDYFIGPTGPNQWSWLEVYPQHGFYTSENMPDKDGNIKNVEQVSVGIAQNAVDGKLGVLSHPRAHGRSFHDGVQPPPEQCDFTGRNFAEQWERAFQLDPEFVFITGWNEWIASRFSNTAPFHGASEQAVNFVDLFNREFSRDIEPMKEGHGDLFYYQMIAQNRKFKGVRDVDSIHPQPITIDGQFEDWKNVTPEFRDTIGDPARRNERGWGKETRYVNETGCNDIVAAKVSVNQKKDTLYFYVRTHEPITGLAVDKPNSMLLLIDSDSNAQTGYLGYDILASISEGTISLYKESAWKVAGSITGAAWRDNEAEFSVPIFALGWKTLPKQFLFKWADGIELNGEWSDFTLHGDVAPNDRYNYKAVLP